jgi:Domain of unknown function (DUF4281)
MTHDSVYSLLNLVILPFWLLLAFAPRWRFTQLLAHSVLVPLLLGCFYLFYLGGAMFGGGGPQGGGFGNLEALKTLFSYKPALIAGWAHYLVFDLFIGAWIVRDAQRRRINHGMIVPILFFSVMAGPLGLLLYLLLRGLRTGAWGLDERL